jgi:hypothetical protein
MKSTRIGITDARLYTSLFEIALASGFLQSGSPLPFLALRTAVFLQPLQHRAFPRICAGDTKKAEKALEEGIAHNAEPVTDLQHAYDKLHLAEQEKRDGADDDDGADEATVDIGKSWLRSALPTTPGACESTATFTRNVNSSSGSCNGDTFGAHAASSAAHLHSRFA